MKQKKTDSLLADATRHFSEDLKKLHFSSPVEYVYNPLDYAWEPYAEYICRFGKGKKKVLFMGMNPGPWGMVQTGIPFGDIPSITGWLGIHGPVGAPAVLHPKRPVTGFDCHRREQSGRRFWGLMEERFQRADVFFKTHFVTNYCPLAFFNSDGKNITPNVLCKKDRDPLLTLCDSYLMQTIELLESSFIIGIGKFAEKRIVKTLENAGRGTTGIYTTGSILHPSPANPAANSGWAEKVTRQLIELGVW